MMGSGKTTVAKIIADKLSYLHFVDTDDLIVQNQKCSINEIFEKKGEAEFRRIESFILKDVLQNDNQVISTGGGIVISPQNLESLKKKSIVFYLSADENVIFERLKNNKDRPLLNCDDMMTKISNLLLNRKHLYEKAHFTVITNNLTPQKIADEVIRKSGINGNR